MGENRTYSVNQVARYLQIVAIALLLLYFGKSLFVPLFFGLLVAFISYPICKWFEKKGLPRGLAVGTVLLLVVLLFLGLLSLLGYELSLFLNDLPQVRIKVLQFINEIRIRLEADFGFPQSLQEDVYDVISLSAEKSLMGLLGNVLNMTTSTVLNLILIPIYCALFLYHRKVFVRFLESIVSKKYKEKLPLFLHQSIVLYFKFVKGTFFVYCIVGVLNSAGLLLLGIKHAILFGMVTAFMTAIPYIGIIISAALPVSVALITKDSAWYAMGVVLVFTVVQYLEANIIFPRVVGEQLNLSTWATIVAMFAGTILWGLAGMILFLPFAAILKIISDHVDELKPVNILLRRD